MEKRMYSVDLNLSESVVLRRLLRDAFEQEKAAWVILKSHAEFYRNDPCVMSKLQQSIMNSEADMALYNALYMAVYPVASNSLLTPLDPPAAADADEACVTTCEPEEEEASGQCCGTCQYVVTGEQPSKYSCTNPASPYGCDFVDADEFCEEWIERLPEAVEKQCSTCRFACPDPSYGYLCINSSCAFCGYPVGREHSQNLNCTSWVPCSELQSLEETIAPIIAQDMGMDKLPLEPRPERRFYVVKSSLYGVTVYDRTIQAPAFAQGADTGMSDARAVTLSCRLNRMEQDGKLLS